MCYSASDPRGPKRCDAKHSTPYDRKVDREVNAVVSGKDGIDKCHNIRELVRSEAGRKVLDAFSDTAAIIAIKEQQRNTLMDCNAQIPSYAKDILKDNKQLSIVNPSKRFDGNVALKYLETYNETHPNDPIDLSQYRDRKIDVSHLTKKEQKKLLDAGVLQKTGDMEYSVENAIAFSNKDGYELGIRSFDSRGKKDKKGFTARANIFPHYVGAELGKPKQDDIPYRQALKLHKAAIEFDEDWRAKNGCPPPLDKNGKDTYPTDKWDAYGSAMVAADRIAKDTIKLQEDNKNKLAKACFDRFDKGDTDRISQTVAFLPHKRHAGKPTGHEPMVDPVTGKVVRDPETGAPQVIYSYASKSVERFAHKLQDDRDKETLDILQEKKCNPDLIENVKGILNRPSAKFDRQRTPEQNINAMFYTTAAIKKELTKPQYNLGSSEQQDILDSIKTGDPVARELVRSATDPKFTVTLSNKAKLGHDDYKDDEHFATTVSNLGFAICDEGIKVSDKLSKANAQQLIADNPGKIDPLIGLSEVPVRGHTRVRS